MNQLTESELQTLEQMEPHEFHRVLMQIVADGMTAWKNESARPRRIKKRRTRQPALAPSIPLGQENVELAEVLS